MMRLYYTSLFTARMGPLSLETLKTKENEVDLASWPSKKQQAFKRLLLKAVFDKYNKKIIITPNDSAHLCLSISSDNEIVLYTGGIVQRNKEVYWIHPESLLHIMRELEPWGYEARRVRRSL